MTNINRTNPDIHAAGEQKSATGREHSKHSPGHTHEEDMKHKRKSGDVERGTSEHDEGNRRGGQSQNEMNEEESDKRSHSGTQRSRNM